MIKVYMMSNVKISYFTMHSTKFEWIVQAD